MTSPWPSPDECRRLMVEAGCDPRILEHVQAVATVAQKVVQALHARGHNIDPALVAAGALLHDIGRSRSHGLDHALIGAGILRARGLPEPLCLVVERHTGAGIDLEEASLLGLPARDYTPQTLEEKVVCHSDNLVDGARRQKVHEELAHLQARGLDRVAAKMRRLHQELSGLAGRDLDDLA